MNCFAFILEVVEHRYPVDRRHLVVYNQSWYKRDDGDTERSFAAQLRPRQVTKVMEDRESPSQPQSLVEGQHIPEVEERTRHVHRRASARTSLQLRASRSPSRAVRSRSRQRSRQPSRQRSGSRQPRSRSRIVSSRCESRRQPRSRSRHSRGRESRILRSPSNRPQSSGSHRSLLLPSNQPHSPGSHRSRQREDRHHHSRLHSPGRRGSSHREHRSRSPLRRYDHPKSREITGNASNLDNKGRNDLLTTHNTLASNDTIQLLVNALKSIAPDSDRVNSVHNAIPEFDPAKKEQTVTIWLHKVNECATIYSWSEKQIIHYSLPKLKGVAKRWYEGLPSVLFTWKEWQSKLLAAFPSDENYGQMLTDMLAKRARFGDSLEDYFYDKIALVNRCGIVGKKAVECVLHGIDDRAVRLGAEAAQYEDLDKLLTYLRNSRNIKVNSDKRNINKVLPNKSIDGQPSAQNTKQRVIRCLNCKREGHMVSQCTAPIKRCGKCSKIGHETEKCYSNLPGTEKSINRVAFDTQTSNKYYKTAVINNVPLDAFIDLGSECSMIKSSYFLKLGIHKIDYNNLPVLRGFGNSMVGTLGRVEAYVDVDGVGAHTELFIVPDNVMQVPLMIGQTYTEQSHVLIQKTSDRLDILCHDGDIVPVDKIKLHCFDKSIVSGLTVVEVYTEPTFTGALFIEGGLRNGDGSCHYVHPGLYHFNQDGKGNIAINGMRSEPLVFNKDLLIARGNIAHENIERNVLRVSALGDQDQHGLITPSEVQLGKDLNQSTIDNLLNLLNKYRSCFAFSMSELGNSKISEMSISLQNDVPVVYRPYRLAIKEKEVVRKMINELLEHEIIRTSTSSYSSPIVLVKKKTGDYRLCIDYRALNNNTIKEIYPMPLIDDQIDKLSGNTYFTTLDLASGYYQIPIREQDRHKTAFVTPEGHFEFNRMPFGLANAPATFQRMMHQVLGSLRHKEALAYLDDIIIPSVDIAEGMERLEQVLKLLLEAGLTLKLSKCVFFGLTVDYLGFEISSEGIRPGSAKIEAVHQFPTPTNQHHVRQFLGLASFFRRFVQGFSILARPLTQLLRKNTEWVWGQEQENSFQSLKNILIQKPVLALYNPKANTELHTDACKMGIAGILLQSDDQNKLRPIAYFSRQTTPEEQNYSSYDLETLAVVASFQKFRVYLVGVHFKVVTDCNSLRATFSKRDMLPRVARWWTLMQEFDFKIEYRAGTSMNHVDALSRNPPIQTVINEEYSVCNVTETDWIVTVQNSDSEIQRIIGILNDPNLNDVTDIKNNYKLKNGKLFRITIDGDRWVVPKGVRWQVVKKNHDDIGHFAVDKTLEKIKLNFWFPKMRRFVKKYVSSCLECAYSKATAGKKPGFLHPIEKVKEPFDTIHLDHVGPFVKSSKGNMYILTLIDAFTRFIYLKAVRNTKSSTSIKVLRDYMGIFGVPRRIISDRGSSFTSDSFKAFVSEKGIKHVLNAVATPRANGQVERYNRVIVDALTAKCVGNAENKWDDHLSDVQWGTNNTFNKGINRTPAEALFGIRPKGSSDSRLLSAIDEGITKPETEFDLDAIRNEISSFVENSQQMQKNRYDKTRLKPVQYNEGDLVRIERHVPATGKSKKLIPKFQGPYKITKVYDHDRYEVEDTPITRKANKKYTTVVAVDKLKPWLNFSRPHDDILSDEESE